jgi:hypothetical protein
VNAFILDRYKKKGALRFGPVRRAISLIESPSLAKPRTAALFSSRRKYPSYWIRSADVSRLGLIVAAPIAVRI